MEGFRAAPWREGLDPNRMNELVTTSGVCVQSPNGQKYITCASHSFSEEPGSEVWHPDGNGQMVGTLQKTFSDIDIGLVKLEDDIKYSDETFSTSQYATHPFQSIEDPLIATSVGDTMHMNTVSNDHCEGKVMAIDVRELRTDEPAPRTQYVSGIFAYLGNGGNELFDGRCGGVIWTDDYKVIGQYQMLNSLKKHKEANWSYCPGFSSLIYQQYSLSSI